MSEQGRAPELFLSSEENTHVHWEHYEEPNLDECEQIIRSVESEIDVQVHDVVRKHVRERRTDPSHAFPRFEVHFDRYLFGHLHLPTSIDDGVAEFAELTIIATSTSCWTLLRVPSLDVSDLALSKPIINDFRGRIRRLQEGINRDRGVGELIGRLFTVVVNELEKVMAQTGASVQVCVSDLDRVDDRHLSRAMKEQVPEIRERASDLRMEVASLGIVVDEISMILDEIVNDRLDLYSQTEDGAKQELFDQHTEIHLRDTHYRSRRLRIVHDEQLEKLGFVFDTIGHLNDADEVTSGRFMGAIASIMLLPTFIVGLYGMNFDSMPELHWPIGYGFAAILIVVVTVFQVWYFRQKRWL